MFKDHFLFVVGVKRDEDRTRIQMTGASGVQLDLDIFILKVKQEIFSVFGTEDRVFVEFSAYTYLELFCLVENVIHFIGYSSQS